MLRSKEKVVGVKVTDTVFLTGGGEKHLFRKVPRQFPFVLLIRIG
jgi:hypothetical protein